MQLIYEFKTEKIKNHFLDRVNDHDDDDNDKNRVSDSYHNLSGLD